MNGLLKHRQSFPAEYSLNPFTKLHQEVDHAMRDLYDLFGATSPSLGTFENVRLAPALDILEEKDHFKIEAEMPGLGEEEIKISTCENVLTIEGEKTVSKKDEKKNFLSREISYGRYERSITLPPTADLDKATASFKKGMLWVTIPKKAGSKNAVRKINIQKAK